MLSFHNLTPKHVFVAYMFYAPDVCGDAGNFQAIGWFGIDPFSFTVVYENSLHDVNNRFWYFYAESDDRQEVWSGEYDVYCTQEAFNHCLDVGSSDARILGFRQIDVGNSGDSYQYLTLS